MLPEPSSREFFSDRESGTQQSPLLPAFHLSILPKCVGRLQSTPLHGKPTLTPSDHFQVSEILQMTIPMPCITHHPWDSRNAVWMDTWPGRHDATALTLKHLGLGDLPEEAVTGPVSHPPTAFFMVERWVILIFHVLIFYFTEF